MVKLASLEINVYRDAKCGECFNIRLSVSRSHAFTLKAGFAKGPCGQYENEELSAKKRKTLIVRRKIFPRKICKSDNRK